MPELEREEFMANREEQIRSARERADVAQMVARSADAAAQGNKKKKIGKAAAAGSDDDDDGDYGSGEASRSTRSRKTTGSSKTKAEGIEKLKQSRAAKGKKKQKVRPPLTCNLQERPRADVQARIKTSTGRRQRR